MTNKLARKQTTDYNRRPTTINPASTLQTTTANNCFNSTTKVRLCCCHCSLSGYGYHFSDTVSRILLLYKTPLVASFVFLARCCTCFCLRSMLNLKEDTYHKYTSRSGRFVEMIAYFLSCITQHNQSRLKRALSLCSQNRYCLKMVKVGDFSLQLVDATTKEPFKEHVAPTDGQSYAGKIIYLPLTCVVYYFSSFRLDKNLFSYCYWHI